MSEKAYLAKVLLLVAVLLLAACSKTAQLPLLSADATVLAFGDSLTAGNGAGEAESYPEVLSVLTGLKVINAGVSGEVSESGLRRLPELLDRERPSLLILCHGGNDLLGHTDHQLIADNLRNMIRLAMDRGIPVLLIAVPSPDLSLKPPPLYESLAKEFNIPIEAKALSHILAKGSHKSDYIHPNAAGYRLLAEALADLLKKSGALPS